MWIVGSSYRRAGRGPRERRSRPAHAERQARVRMLCVCVQRGTRGAARTLAPSEVLSMGSGLLPHAVLKSVWNKSSSAPYVSPAATCNRGAPGGP